MIMCKKPSPVLNIPAGDLSLNVLTPYRQKEKVVVIMGATGTGKSRLSIDLATRFPSEIVNSDKMQVYEGLEIVTNKITEEETCGIPHHLLGTVDPNVDFTSHDFCQTASNVMGSITSRGQVPIIVGGSNSYVESLVNYEATKFRSRYEFCFLWVDVSVPVLHSFVSSRVDRMVENGMVEEVRKVFDRRNHDYSRGIRKAIGVPEFDRYFREEDDERKDKLLQEAIYEVKNNTCKLACRQLEKIYRLRSLKGWKVHRLDATEVFRKRRGGRETDEVWDKVMTGPSTAIVANFLYNFVDLGEISNISGGGVRAAVLAGASH